MLKTAVYRTKDIIPPPFSPREEFHPNKWYALFMRRCPERRKYTDANADSIPVSTSPLGTGLI